MGYTHIYYDPDSPSTPPTELNRAFFTIKPEGALCALASPPETGPDGTFETVFTVTATDSQRGVGVEGDCRHRRRLTSTQSTASLAVDSASVDGRVADAGRTARCWTRVPSPLPGTSAVNGGGRRAKPVTGVEVSGSDGGADPGLGGGRGRAGHGELHRGRNETDPARRRHGEPGRASFAGHDGHQHHRGDADAGERRGARHDADAALRRAAGPGLRPGDRETSGDGGGERPVSSPASR